jgi:hypothetical protein
MIVCQVCDTHLNKAFRAKYEREMMRLIREAQRPIRMKQWRTL